MTNKIKSVASLPAVSGVKDSSSRNKRGSRVLGGYVLLTQNSSAMIAGRWNITLIQRFEYNDAAVATCHVL